MDTYQLKALCPVVTPMSPKDNLWDYKNCTEETDYIEQVEFIGQKFIQKGYDEDFIKRIEQVSQMERTILIEDKMMSDKYQDNMPIMLNYSIQHKKMENFQETLAHPHSG